MPVPILLIPAVISGVAGVGTFAKGVLDNGRADEINDDANSRLDDAQKYMERSRVLCADLLSALGDEKIFVLNGSIARFIAAFEQIKNLELEDSVGLEELRRLKIDRESMAELKEMQHFAADVAGGAVAGLAGGALTALGAYSAVVNLASASTGTAISALSGAAAKSATLAFLGGGTIARGGAGMVGGKMVLGGFVVGPALLAMGLITGKKASEKLDTAKKNAAEAEKICTEITDAAFKCNAIRRRTVMLYTFLTRLDARLIPLVSELCQVLEDEGTDYRTYSPEAKSTVLRAATMAGSVKAVLDTPILSEDGALTDESAELLASLGATLAPTTA